MLIFELPGKKQRLAFTGSVLKSFEQHRQFGLFSKEAGGQLFAKITPDIVIVAVATGPHRKDLRSLFGFVPNKARLKIEILEYFNKGFHYVGDWHSHPQRNPRPSTLDLQSMKQCFSRSKHELEHFILVIVGNNRSPNCLWVGAIDSKSIINLANNHVQRCVCSRTPASGV